VVLLKSHDSRGFVFYTNFQSRKGEELLDNPHAALCFFWHELYEQVRVEGPCEPVSDEEADAYFATRPRMSQIGAWASEQSRPLESRAVFEQSLQETERRFEGQDVPRPPHWSGFRVRPQRMEFWRGIDNRLHERTLYWEDDDRWRKVLLFP
jgi:pyridoxamine 5'-phosphate oxidase